MGSVDEHERAGRVCAVADALELGATYQFDCRACKFGESDRARAWAGLLHTKGVIELQDLSWPSRPGVHHLEVSYGRRLFRPGGFEQSIGGFPEVASLVELSRGAGGAGSEAG